MRGVWPASVECIPPLGFWASQTSPHAAVRRCANQLRWVAHNLAAAHDGCRHRRLRDRHSQHMQRARLVMTRPWPSGLIVHVRLCVREGARVSLQLWGRCTPPARPARPKWQSCCGRVKMKGTLEKNRVFHSTRDIDPNDSLVERVATCCGAWAGALRRRSEPGPAGLGCSGLAGWPSAARRALRWR